MAKGKGNPWKTGMLVLGGLAVLGGVAAGSVAIANHVRENKPAEEVEEEIKTPETENEAEAEAMATYADAIANFNA